MRAPLRPALPGAFAGALLTTLMAGTVLLLAPAPALAAEAGKQPAASGTGADAAGALPLPPEPPRVASGPEYEACLALVRTDPEAAATRAGEWEERGGGDGARHCLALALLAAGDPEGAAGRLERLAAGSDAGTRARASVFAQAAQAWMMAGIPERARLARGAVTGQESP